MFERLIAEHLLSAYRLTAGNVASGMTSGMTSFRKLPCSIVCLQTYVSMALRTPQSPSLCLYIHKYLDLSMSAGLFIRSCFRFVQGLCCLVGSKGYRNHEYQQASLTNLGSLSQCIGFRRCSKHIALLQEWILFRVKRLWFSISGNQWIQRWSFLTHKRPLQSIHVSSLKGLKNTGSISIWC